MSGRSHASWDWIKVRDARMAIARDLGEPCHRCGQPIDYTLDGRTRWGPTCDHLIPLVAGGKLVADPADLAPAHRSCNVRHGARVGNIARGKRRRGERSLGGRVSVARPTSPVSAPPYGPRFMSERSPTAVGSLWDEIGPWLADQGLVLREWQQLVMERAMEVDGSGRLCWRTVVVSTPRQSGKSWLIRAAAMARCGLPGLFGGEPQEVIHAASLHAAARRIHAQAWSWARSRDLVVRQALGGERVIWPDGSSWDAMTLAAVYGMSANLILLDEVWGVSPLDYREGLRPTQVARTQPQLWAISTAHRRATRLMPELMESAMAGVGRTMLADWGARPGQDLADPVGWEAVSPWWDDQRGEEMGMEVTSAGFAEQWLNVWPEADDVGRWLPGSATAAASGRVGAQAPADAVCAVECTPDGRRWAVAAVWPHGRSGVRARVWLLDSPGECVRVVGDRRVWAFPAVAKHPALRRRAVEPMNVSADRAATTELRDAVLEGVLSVGGLPAGQWAAARTVPADGGEVLSGQRSTGDIHGLKALSWGVWALQSDRHTMSLVM